MIDAGNRITGVDISTFDVIAQNSTGVVFFSTVVPASFAGVDSFDEMRFRFIAGHPS